MKQPWNNLPPLAFIPFFRYTKRETGPAAGGEADDADAVAGSLEMADAVVETEVEMSGKPEAGAVDAVHETPPAEPVRPQVVEQTLF